MVHGALVLAALSGFADFALQEVYVPGAPGQVMYRTSAALVLVGADFPGERAFANSAESLRNTLVQEWKFPAGNVRIRMARTKEEAARELDWLRSNTTEEDRVLVAYICHGIEGSQGPELDLGLGTGRYRMDDASADFAKVMARHKLLILDACNSGGASAGPAAGLVTHGPEAVSRRSSAILLTSDPGREARIGATHTRFVETLQRESHRAASEARGDAVWLSQLVPGRELGFTRFGTLGGADSSQVLLDPLPVDRSAEVAGRELRDFDPKREAERKQRVIELRRWLERGVGSEGERAIRRLMLAQALAYEPDPARRRESLREAVEKLQDIRGLPKEYTGTLSWLLASSLYWLGDIEGNDELLQDAVDEWRSLTQTHAREAAPMIWAKSLVNLGNALSRLGEREAGAKTLNEAVEAYRASLQVVTRAAAPELWATVQSNLGHALRSLGELEPGNQRLEEAVAAYRAALEVRTRERYPSAWIATQSGLAATLGSLGQREPGTERIREAIAACRAALEVASPQTHPTDWAELQHNLGAALSLLGQKESSTEHLEQAIAAFRAALQVSTREAFPAVWASTQGGLGAALAMLGQREAGTQRLEEAVAALRAALEGITREKQSRAWAQTQYNLGTALAILGSRTSGTASLEAAVAAYRAALEVITRERSPRQWAVTQSQLGGVLQVLGDRSPDPAKPLGEAVAAYRASLEVITREASPRQWALTQYHLGQVLRTLGLQENGTAKTLEEAVAACRAAQQVFTREAFPVQWARLQQDSGVALIALGEIHQVSGRLEEGITAIRASLEILTREKHLPEWANSQLALGRAHCVLAERRDRKRNLEAARDHLRLAEAGYRQLGDDDSREAAQQLLEQIEKDLKGGGNRNPNF